MRHLSRAVSTQIRKCASDQNRILKKEILLVQGRRHKSAHTCLLVLATTTPEPAQQGSWSLTSQWNHV
uniref:Uncharacterized protein n=1 Tax=Arundo donax TaxID=35708 RepID=A0A0A9C6N3_ARUDO